MKIKLCFQSLFSLASLASMAACQAGTAYITTTEHLTCGKANFTIESTCKKASEADTLNECKPQVLTAPAPQGTRKIKLPEMTADESQRYKKIGGVIKDLYVVRWGCAQAQGSNVLVLSYSIGGGSAPYSEARTKYNEAGQLVGREVAIDPPAQLLLDQSMKPVRSIMPE